MTNLLPLCAVLSVLCVSCAARPTLPTVAHVDLARFMGDWYVQAHIPALGEGEAYNGVESYALDDDGRILTSYVFRKGGFDKPFKTLQPSAVVRDTATHAEWGMRLVWPFRAEFLIAHVDEGYTETIVARTKRDYVWIMTRAPEISDERLATLTERVRELGYDTDELRRVPQRWPDAEHPVSQAGGDLARYTRRD